MSPQSRKIRPLYGLVLAGGRGVRLGRDKGELDYHGQPQVRWTYELLAASRDRRFVSVRSDQLNTQPYRDLPLIADEGEDAGPAAGLNAALRREAHATRFM